MLCAAQTVTLLFAPPVILPLVAGHATSVRADGTVLTRPTGTPSSNITVLQDEHKGELFKQLLFCGFHACVKRIQSSETKSYNLTDSRRMCRILVPVPGLSSWLSRASPQRQSRAADPGTHICHQRPGHRNIPFVEMHPWPQTARRLVMAHEWERRRDCADEGAATRPVAGGRHSPPRLTVQSVGGGNRGAASRRRAGRPHDGASCTPLPAHWRRRVRRPTRRSASVLLVGLAAVYGSGPRRRVSDRDRTPSVCSDPSGRRRQRCPLDWPLAPPPSSKSSPLPTPPALTLISRPNPYHSRRYEGFYSG